MMDPRLLYTDFLMDGEEVLLQPTTDAEPTFKDDRGYTYCALAVFRSDDSDLARDPLSTNRRLQNTADFEMFGTMIVAGPTPEQIFVLIPDSVGPTVDAELPADLQHVVGLRLGSAENLSSTLPTEGLLRPTLSLGRNDYWSEVSPILRKWQIVNDASCPHCHRIIRVNMSRYLRAAHTECQCFWRCPVSSCPMWFSSELNGKDHLKRIHNFKEGQGYSFYECLRQFGLEWFGRRSFFYQREVTGQGLWMDLALARRSGQALHNNYTITNSPALAPVRKFFRAAIRNLTSIYENRVYAQSDIASAYLDQGYEIPEVESLSLLIISSATPPPVVSTQMRSVTPNNWSLTYLQSGPFDQPQCYLPLARGAVSSVSLASSDLLSHVEPLPLDQLVFHSADTVRSGPVAARNELLAVAHRDIAVARRNLADLTIYLDNQSTHLAACTGAMDDSIPLMSVETFLLCRVAAVIVPGGGSPSVSYGTRH